MVQEQEEREFVGWRRWSRLALGLGVLGMLLGWLCITSIPQRPDGDAMAMELFDNQFSPVASWRQVHDAPWYNGAGALVAWAALEHFLRAVGRLRAAVAARSFAPWFGSLFWCGVLVALLGWGWNQSRGWQGELFLEPSAPLPLGIDQTPEIVFSRFLIPPAPDGEGRALSLRLLVDGRAHEIAEAAPYRADGWEIRPRWYGATVRSKAFHNPLFFGADDVRSVPLRGGGQARVEVDVEALTVRSGIPLSEVKARHHAILRARFAPGSSLLRVGGGVMVLSMLLALGQHSYNAIRRKRRGRFRGGVQGLLPAHNAAGMVSAQRSQQGSEEHS